jgi:hypothetical protein
MLEQGSTAPMEQITPAVLFQEAAQLLDARLLALR